MKPTTVAEYLDSFPSAQKTKLAELRRLLTAALPDTQEALKWGNPALLDKDGMILLVFSGHKNHMNLVATPSTKQALADDLSGYVTGKGSVQLAYDKPLPAQLITKMAKHRAQEYRQDGVTWR